MGEQQVEDDLCVEGPVPGVVEDEDGVDFERGGEVGGVDGFGEGLRCGGVVVCPDFVEGPYFGVGDEDVAWGDDGLETISLCYGSAHIWVAAGY